MVRLRTLEGGQEGMVNVDHLRKPGQKVSAQHLHVFGEHRQINLMLFQQPENGGLSVGLAVLRHGNTDERNAEISTAGFQIRMIRNHQGNLHRQLSAACPPEQIEQTVVLLADQDRHPGVVIGKTNLGVTAKTFRQRLHRRGNGLPR